MAEGNPLLCQANNKYYTNTVLAKSILVLTVLFSFSSLLKTPAQEPSLLKAPIAEAASNSFESELITRTDFERYIDQEAPKYGVSPAKVKAVIECESSFNPNAVGDHGQSFGLSQIFLPSHSTISKKQATNPKFALDYMIQNFYKDHWSCQGG